MKHILLLFSQTFVATMLFSAYAYGNESCFNPLKINTIDARDSVYYNLEGAQVSGDIVEIPVFIITDDIINALDFEMSFDTEKMTFLTIIDHTGHIQSTFFFNTNDSTLRFTSNSLTNYNTAVKIISIRFKMSSLCITGNDFFSVKNWLNGDGCSVKLNKSTVVCRPSANEDTSIDSKYAIYPVPTSNKEISVVGDENGFMEVFDNQGKVVLGRFPFVIKEKIILSNLKAGVYYVKIHGRQSSLTKRIILLND